MFKNNPYASEATALQDELNRLRQEMDMQRVRYEAERSMRDAYAQEIEALKRNYGQNNVPMYPPWIAQKPQWVDVGTRNPWEDAYGTWNEGTNTPVPQPVKQDKKLRKFLDGLLG